MEEAQFRCKQNLNMLCLTCEISKGAVQYTHCHPSVHSKHLVTAQRLWENYTQRMYSAQYHPYSYPIALAP